MSMKMELKTPLANEMPHQMRYQLRQRFEKKADDSIKPHYRNYSRYTQHEGGLNNFLFMLSAEDRDNFEKLNEAAVEFSDLSALTEDDLKLVGFKNAQERKEMLKNFAEYPFQGALLTDIYQDPDSQKYNKTILNNATAHLERLKSIIELNKTKVLLNCPEDDILGEKYYASRFTVGAMKELYKLTADVDKELTELKELATKDSYAKKNASTGLISLTLLTGAILAGICIWKLK